MIKKNQISDDKSKKCIHSLNGSLVLILSKFLQNETNIK